MDSTKPPSDEVIGKIKAIMGGYEYGKYDESSDGWINGKDPRTDPDSADELLHWLITYLGDKEWLITAGEYWMIWPDHKDIGIIIPISGEPKRTAICNLALVVMKIVENV